VRERNIIVTRPPATTSETISERVTAVAAALNRATPQRSRSRLSVFFARSPTLRAMIAITAAPIP
jgi:hypothetical protein